MSLAIAAFICDLSFAKAVRQSKWQKGWIAMKATDSQLDVVTVADYGQLSQEIVELFVSEALEAIELRERFCTAISRDTPGSFFELLWAKRRSKDLQWDKIHFFWVDECCDRYGSNP